MGTVLLMASLHRAKLIGWQGSRADGLGFRPVRRVWLLVLLISVPLVQGCAFWLTRAHAALPVFTATDFSAEAAYAGSGAFSRTLIAVGSVGLAPVAEELFFRGWLWTGLRRFWFPFATMVGTAAPWLLLHVVDDIRTPRRLLPLAIACSLARHYCHSITASITLHMVNNAMALGLIVWLYAR